MQKIFNKDGFNWWIGVVEDRMDPEFLGRCRVRIFGYHIDNKDILPVKDLPWAIPIQPITSAAMSGIGISPLGLVEGTWVLGFFFDGDDMQQPAMLGTIATKAAKMAFKVTDIPDAQTNPDSGILQDSQGSPVLDSQGVPFRAGTPKIEGWVLGQTSEFYESGNKGGGTINDYNGGASGDFGGASYGRYQFASYLPPIMEDGTARESSKNSPVLRFINSSKFKEKFTGLEPATAAFDNKWKEVAATNKTVFEKDQHDYIELKYYKVAVSNIQRAGIDLSKYGPAVQDLIWSTAVHLGPTNTAAFKETLIGKSQLTDRDIVLLVSEWKIKNVNVLFKRSSQRTKDNVRNRFQSEKTALLRLIK